MKNNMESRGRMIMDFFKARRRMPSYAEIAEILKLRSKDSAWRIVQKLVSGGILDKDSKGKLLPKYEWTPKELRVLGLIEAGFGTPAEESELDKMSLDDWLIDDEERSFLLKVKGDSMIDAGIHSGDYCIVEKTSKAREGQIVVAVIDGGWTVKYLRHDKTGFYLEAANSDYKPIRPKEDLKIEAVVKAVIRKY